MNVTTVVNLRKEPYDIYIGRGSKWGNPFKITFNTTRNEVIDMYCLYLYEDRNKHLLDSLHELRGKVLGCYCKPYACHGDVLVRALEEYEYTINCTKPWRKA